MLVFHWCSQERLHCRVVRRMEFDSIESMRRALELSAVLPGHSYDEAFVPWQMFAFGIFVFASLESLDLVICALLSLPLSRKGFLLGFTFHDACVQAVYKELGYDDQKHFRGWLVVFCGFVRQLRKKIVNVLFC